MTSATQVITCISCPVGCRMTITTRDGEVVEISGNQCKRGDVYARQESIQPLRMVTAVAPVYQSKAPVSLKTERPIPKDRIDAAMHEIRALHLQLPIQAGDVLLHNVAGTGVDLIATRSLP